MNEYDAIDAMIERAAREEQKELDQAHAQFILDAVADSGQRREQGAAHLFDVLNRAHLAKAEKADKE